MLCSLGENEPLVRFLLDSTDRSEHAQSLGCLLSDQIYVNRPAVYRKSPQHAELNRPTRLASQEAVLAWTFR
jgi:hypothetical protein